MEINKTVIKPDVIWTIGNHPTLPHCSKEGGVFFYGLYSRDVNINDDDVYGLPDTR